MTKRYVFTGSSYSGKTTVIGELARQGFSTVPEAATIVISEQLATGEDILPWTKRDEFFEKLIEKQLKLEAKVPADRETVFLDRSMPDELAYFNYFRIKPTDSYERAFKEHRYDRVFLFETLPGYQQDEIRREPLEMVLDLRVLHEQAYRELGYNVITVPVMSVPERVNFILDRI